MRDLLELIHERFGPPTRRTTGAQWFKSGSIWEPGIQISTGHRMSLCMIDIRGERLSVMTGEDAIGLLNAICSLGFKATRIDAAIDWVGQDVKLFDHALASCEARELCKLRSYASDCEYSTEGVAKRRLLKLGKRDSPVCARIYDKGLQQHVAWAGYWERLEVEFKADRAPQVARKLVDASGDGWLNVLSSLVIGAIDFRAKNDRNELNRRERCGWWATLTDGLEAQATAPEASTKSFERWLEAFRVSYGQRIAQFATVSNLSIGSLTEILLKGVCPASPNDATLSGFRLFHQSSTADRASS